MFGLTEYLLTTLPSTLILGVFLRYLGSPLVHDSKVQVERFQNYSLCSQRGTGLLWKMSARYAGQQGPASDLAANLLNIQPSVLFLGVFP